MADGYLEKHQADYEARKAAWLRKQRHLPNPRPSRNRHATSGNSNRQIERPDDESL